MGAGGEVEGGVTAAAEKWEREGEWQEEWEKEVDRHSRWAAEKAIAALEGRALEKGVALEEGEEGAVGGGGALALDGGAVGSGVLLAELLAKDGGGEKGESTGRSECGRDQNRVWDPGGRWFA